MRITWKMDEVTKRARLYLDENGDHVALTLYWGEDPEDGSEFSVSGGIGPTYYSHDPIEAHSIAEAKEKAEMWFADRIMECLGRYRRSVEYYESILEMLPNPSEKEEAAT